MIKAVEKIPIRETIKPISRAQSVRDDVREAIDNRIPRFEFVGKIYCPNETHKTFLTKSLVRDESFRIIYLYLRSFRKGSFNILKNCDPDDVFKVYRYSEPDHDRIFMEIYFDKLDSFIDKIKEANE